ncbi:uncharacterized protein LOC116810335 [Hylobates moloch]|uniref:uncharacterized protein LOC116810335 n=1 Tax=Hylobates moloch TaxID=81572 RepID=UPI0013F1E547|nr:uncharacterized protein LOC116810335 [Hylobates moloch]
MASSSEVSFSGHLTGFQRRHHRCHKSDHWLHTEAFSVAPTTCPDRRLVSWGGGSGAVGGGREGGSGEPRPRATVTETLAVRRALAPNFQSGAQERRWASRRVAACPAAAPGPPSSPPHPHPCWPLPVLKTGDPAVSACPAATLLPSALNEARRRRPRGELGMAAVPLSQPLPWTCPADVQLCGHLRADPPRPECSKSEQKFRAGRAQPQRSLSLAGTCTTSKCADARQHHLIVLYTRDRSLRVAAAGEAEQQA